MTPTARNSQPRLDNAHVSQTPGTDARTDPRTVAIAGLGGVKSLAKGLRVLALLVDGVDINTTEVAGALDVDKSGASRILRTLVDAGFAVRGPDRRYRAGPKLNQGAGNPGRAIALPYSIKERARPLLEQLHRLTSETVTLGLRVDDQVLYLDKIVTELPLRVERPIGALAPLHCTALGKVLLAFNGGHIPRLSTFTGHTTTRIEDLQAQLKQIVELGYSRDDEEIVQGVRCVAAPLRDPATRAVVAAMGISGPAARIPVEQLEVLGELTRRVASEFGQ